MDADQVLDCLKVKAEQTWSSVASLFRDVGPDGRGRMRKRDLQELCFRFNLPMSESEMEKLWRRVDEDGRGFVTHRCFLDKLNFTASRDQLKVMEGTSEEIAEGNEEWLRKHEKGQHEKHEEMTSKQINFVATSLTPQQVKQQIKDRFRENFSSLDLAFKSLDRDQDGMITIKDLRRLLRDLNYFLTADQFEELLHLLQLPTDPASRITYSHFLRCVDDDVTARDVTARDVARRDVMDDPVTLGQLYAKLPSAKMMSKLGEIVASNKHTLQSVFASHDRNGSGRINVTDFRRVINTFCMTLTDKHFRFLLGTCESDAGATSGTHGGAKSRILASVNYRNFIENFTTTAAASPMMQHQAEDLPAQQQQVVTVVDRFGELMTTVQGQTIADELGQVLATGASLDRGHFRRVVEESCGEMNDGEFEQLWQQQTKTASNSDNLDFIEFLDKYKVESKPIASMSTPAPSCSKQSSRAQSRLSRASGKDLSMDELEEELQKLKYEEEEEEDANAVGDATDARKETVYTRQAITPPSRPMTGQDLGVMGRAVSRTPHNSDDPAVQTKLSNLHSRSSSMMAIEDKVHPAVAANWKKMQKKCQGMDAGKTNLISAQQLIDMLDEFGVLLTPPEARELCDRYSREGSEGKICYKSFFKHFLLTLHPREEHYLERKMIHKSRLPVMFGKETDEFVDVMIKLRQRLLRSWREMRRTFRTHDVNAIGVVSPKVFRQVLKEYSINLSEEDYFNLMSYYDSSMSGKIPYNEFLRSFLKN